MIEPRLLCLTGMHRSGTSAVSRVVNILGVDLGDERELLEGSDNPLGFWESLPLTKLGEAVLHRHGGSWDDPPVLRDGWERSGHLDTARSEASARLDRMADGSPVLGWKDPRSCILLPFWRTVSAVDRTLLMVRDPREVAWSLARRNRFHPERSAYLWLRYMVAGWRADPDVVVVHFEDLLADPFGTASWLAGALALPAPDADQRALIYGAVEPGLRHAERVGGGPVMQLAMEHHSLVRNGDRAAVGAAGEELHRRWMAAEPAERILRRSRTLVRPLLPWGVRRRIRCRVGAVTSWPARRASTVPRPVQGGSPAPTGTVPGRGSAPT